jgi:SOS-response transcriptional repressor LexA
MTIKENCDYWIELTYDEWLQWISDKHRSYLRVSTRNLIDRMKSAASEGRNEEAWNLLERLKRLSDNFNKLEDVSKSDNHKYERPETYMECALTAYRMGDLQEAIRLFQIPVVEFPLRSLHRAISYWLYGCVQWQLPSHLEDAVISWERGLYVLQEAQSDNRNELSIKNWCTAVINIMEQAICDATRLNSPPHPQSSNTPGRRGRSASSQYRARIQAFPVLGSIPAGTPMEVNINPKDKLEFPVVEIFNAKYECYSLRNEYQININPSREYFILKVKGESMNIASPVNIENGDYVLMQKQNTPENGDIVAAEIINLDREATLKRCRFQGGRYILEAESNDQQFQSPEFQKLMTTSEFVIRGIALAVLKNI